MSLSRRLSAILFVSVAIPALALGMAGCSGTGTPVPTVTVTVAPDDAAGEIVATEPALPVNAYPSVGNLVGVVGEGDATACDPSLETMRLETGNAVEYNGYFIKYVIEGISSENSLNYYLSSVTLEFEEGQPDIRSAIVRLADWSGYFNDAEEYVGYDDPTPDMSVNWSEELASSSSAIFRVNDFDVAGDIDAIELCIAPSSSLD